jgi:hypothetical protein
VKHSKRFKILIVFFTSDLIFNVHYAVFPAVYNIQFSYKSPICIYEHSVINFFHKRENATVFFAVVSAQRKTKIYFFVSFFFPPSKIINLYNLFSCKLGFSSSAAHVFAFYLFKHILYSTAKEKVSI